MDPPRGPPRNRPPANGSSGTPSRPHPHAAPGHPPRRRKNHRGGKKKKSRRKSFAASPDDMARDGVHSEEGDERREGFYSRSGLNLSNTSIDSEALLDHREQPFLRPRRPSMMTTGSSQFQFATPQTGSRLKTVMAGESGDDAGPASPWDEHAPLLSSSSVFQRAETFGGYGSNDVRRKSRPGSHRGSSRASSKRRFPAPFAGTATEGYNVNYPPSVPASPTLRPSDRLDISFGDLMLRDELESGQRSPRRTADDDDGRGGAPFQPSMERRHTIALEAETDVCFPQEGLSDIVDDDNDVGLQDSSTYRWRGRRRRGKWPDLAVLDEWSRFEKEGRSEEPRAKKITEPQLINGRLRPVHRGWFQVEEEAPYRFTYFNEEFQSTIHSQTISELKQPGGSFKELFIPDKILVLMRFTPEGYIDYLKLGEEVENFMRIHGAPRVPKRDTERLFSVTPRLTTDPEPLADENYQYKKLHLKERVFAVQDRIYEAFCKYERNEITSEQFLDLLDSLGLRPTVAAIRVLRRRDEMGSCSYANLIQALCIPEEKLHEQPQVSPVRSPFNSPGRSPIKDPGPAPPIKPRLMNLPPSLRDSNVITWSDDPKKEKIQSKAIATRRVVCEDVTRIPSRFVTETLDNEDVPIELAAAKQEKIYALVRDFIEGSTSALEFRMALKEMGIDVNREMERLIGGHERGGHLSFQDFVKYLGIYHEGDVRHTFMEENVEQKPTLNIFQAMNDERPPSPSRDHLPRYMKGTGDVITWTQHNMEPERPKSPTKRFEESREFSIAEAPPLPVHTISVQHVDAHGRPFTPKRHYSHANSSRVSELLQWDLQDQNGVDGGDNEPAQTNGMVHSGSLNTNGQPTSRRIFRKSVDANILTWDKSQDKSGAPTPPRVRTPDKTHATLPNGVIHPKAPFGTDRDVYYNINPHRPNGR